MRALFTIPAVLALACAAPSFAQHVAQTNTTVDADAYVSAPGSPGPGGRARIRAENGSITIIQDSRYFQYDPTQQGPPADPDASVSYGTANNHTRAFATTSESGVVGPNAYFPSSYAEVDLATGTVKAEALNTSTNRAGRAITRAFMADTLYFTNTSGSAVLLPVVFSVGGTILDPHGQGNAGGQAQLRLFTANLGGGRVNFASSGGGGKRRCQRLFHRRQRHPHLHGRIQFHPDRRCERVFDQHLAVDPDRPNLPRRLAGYLP